MNTLFAFFVLFQVVQCERFWISFEIANVQWKSGCIPTSLCSQPRLQIIKKLATINEKVSVSWPINEPLIGRQFVSYWPSGKVDDVQIVAQATGIDRSYGFPRICDESAVSSPFNEEETIEETPMNRTIHIKSKCFDAVAYVTKYVKACPWCHQNTDVVVSSSAELVDRHTPNNVMLIEHLVAIMALFALVTSFVFVVVFMAYIRKRSAQPKIVNYKPKLIPINSPPVYSVCDFKV